MKFPDKFCHRWPLQSRVIHHKTTFYVVQYAWTSTRHPACYRVNTRFVNLVFIHILSTNHARESLFRISRAQCAELLPLLHVRLPVLTHGPLCFRLTTSWYHYWTQVFMKCSRNAKHRQQ